MNQAAIIAILIFEGGILVGWLAWLSKTLVEMKVDVGSRSARQDATLEDHERRITKIEDHCEDEHHSK